MENKFNQKNKKTRKWPKVVGVILSVLLLLILLGPFLIPVKGATGLNEPVDLIGQNGNIITIPFDGTDGIDMYYIYKPAQIKTDQNFILIHGSLYNSYTWNEVIDYLSTKGNVYAYDQAPYGLTEKLVESDWTGANPYTVDSAIVQLEAFMDKMNIDSATLLGSSFGGVLAAEAAVQIPDRVDELIFVDAAVFVTESVPTWLLELPQVDHLGPILANTLASGDSFFESTYFDKSKITDERMEMNKVLTKVNNWNIALWEYLQAWGTAPSDVSTQLDRITQKALIISGAEDVIVPLEQSKQLAEALPNAELVVIDDCGHLPHEECPESFIKVLDNWFEK